MTTQVADTITVRELAELCQREGTVDIIDVRTPAEYREVHCVYAKNVPLDQLDPDKIRQLRQAPDKPLFVICRSGNRAAKACEALRKAGLENVVLVEGGTQAWVEAGLPVVRGKKTISLERQVRIAAGSLVLIGSLLGYFLHPAWMALAAFVGAGLVYSGITDTCAMAMLLARMPWNRVREESSHSPACSAERPRAEGDTREHPASTGCCG